MTLYFIGLTMILGIFFFKWIFTVDSILGCFFSMASILSVLTLEPSFNLFTMIFAIFLLIVLRMVGLQSYLIFEKTR